MLERLFPLVLLLLCVRSDCPVDMEAAIHQFDSTAGGISRVNSTSGAILLQLGRSMHGVPRMTLLVNSSESSVIYALIKVAEFLSGDQPEKWASGYALDMVFHCDSDLISQVEQYMDRNKPNVKMIFELRKSPGSPLLTYPYDVSNHTVAHNDYRVIKRVALAYSLAHPSMHHSSVCEAGVCHGLGHLGTSSNHSLFDDIFESSEALPFRVAIGAAVDAEQIFRDNHQAIFKVFSMLWTSSVWGHVRSKEAHTPIPGASITADSNGFYSRLISPEQELELEIRAENFVVSHFSAASGVVDVEMSGGTPEITLAGIISVSVVFAAVVGLAIFFLCLNWKNKDTMWGAAMTSPLDMLEADFTDQGGDLELETYEYETYEDTV